MFGGLNNASCLNSLAPTNFISIYLYKNVTKNVEITQKAFDEGAWISRVCLQVSPGGTLFNSFTNFPFGNLIRPHPSTVLKHTLIKNVSLPTGPGPDRGRGRQA